MQKQKLFKPKKYIVKIMIGICTLTCYQGVRKICLYDNITFFRMVISHDMLEIFFLFYVIDLDAVLYIYANHSVPWFPRNTITMVQPQNFL